MATDVLVFQSGVGFSEMFESLTGSPPYPWQQQLFLQFLSGAYPRDINLPTGSGKTAIMAIWVAALAQQASERRTNIAIPRRLVWIVDRRVVVDQATEDAEKIRGRLAVGSIPAASQIVRSLQFIAGDQPNPLAISTLRGEREDNREWSGDPSRPAIIVGTVDMIGSRLLFSGYGDSRYWSGQHAGLLGHDALVINDEAHLTPALAGLLRKLENVQSKTLKPFVTIRLSATHPSSTCWPESLGKDREDLRFRAGYEAPKGLDISPPIPLAKFEGAMLELATMPGPARTLVFLREPEKVKKFAAALTKRGVSRDRIQMLTGTMRGFERDQLTGSEAFKTFTAHERPGESWWLLATSAGEVGVNISADRLITDLDTLDHLLQRFGRVNRFGETDGLVHLLVGDVRQKSAEGDSRNIAALDFLRSLPQRQDGLYDVSPSALFGRDLPEAALSEKPLEAPLHNWHIDAWTQTSLGSHPARPAVEPWLHGKQNDYPETYVAWREDVRYLTSDEIDSDDREEVLRKYRLMAHEQLREPSSKFLEKLEELAARAKVHARFLLRKRDGSVQVRDTGEFGKVENETKRRKLVGEIAYCQILLPPGCGRLDYGMFSAEWVEREADQADTFGCDASSEKRYVNRAAFIRIYQADGTWSPKRLGGAVNNADLAALASPDLSLPELRRFASSHGWRFLLRVPLELPDGDTDAAPSELLYFGEAKQQVRPAGDVCLLDRHLSDVSQHAKALAQRLGLPGDIASAIEAAGRLHDLGKYEEIWQKAAGNDGANYKGPAVAKSIPIRQRTIKSLRWRDLNGFRHELGSLRRAEEQLRNEPDELRDLVLHLIAAHHGHARPCFESKAYDRKHLAKSAEIALESARRFARVQKRFGPWGLAYLEAILRAADALASADSEDPAYA